MTDDLERALEQFLVSKGKGTGQDSGNYRRNAKREVQNLLDWLEETPGAPTSFDEWDEEGYQPLRRYARELAQRDVRPNTIQTYWNYVSAFVGWCAREGYLSQNYAQVQAAKEPLPDTEGRRKRDQQTWSREQRLTITRYVRDRAAEAIDEDGSDAIQELRDRALVFLLAYTGIRGGEFLRDPADERRNGIRWRDVDLDREQVEVLSKKQMIDERSLTPKVVPPLERLKTAVDPPSEEWPVLPTLHLPTLYDHARGEIPDERLEEANGHTDVLDLFREYDLVPLALTVDGGRARMEALTEAAGVDVDGDRHDYLAPHGGRRGVGRVLVETRSVEHAADQLDNSTRMVEEAYSDVLAEKRSEDVGDAFDEHDS